MTLFRGTFLDTPSAHFEVGIGAALRVETSAIAVSDGVIVARGSFESLAGDRPSDEVVDLRSGLVLPGLVDTHVHFPQVRAIGALGMPLLDWLDQCALPEEARLAEESYARTIAAEFVSALVGAGTTTSLVFGSHFAAAVDVLFAEAATAGLRVSSGLVVSDRGLPDVLLTSPDRSHSEAVALAAKWHGVGRSRYAVTPRFSYSASDAMLESCAAVLADVPGALFTSHVNENPVEVSEVARLFPGSRDYVDTYDRHGLVRSGSVLAHNVHATDAELAVLAERGAAVAHCPTSNCALGSGIFPLRRHLDAGVAVALGSDVGAGTGFSLFKEGLQAYFMQQLSGTSGVALNSADLLYLATRAGALALGLDSIVGDFSVGREFDAVWVRPAADTPLDLCLRHAADASQALAKTFALATPADVGGVWVGGSPISG